MAATGGSGGLALFKPDGPAMRLDLATDQAGMVLAMRLDARVRRSPGS